mgnify:CR=1 FL=1
MPTIVEVAKHARVSIATVSNVIRGTRRVSPALQERVQTAIRELDYSPNEIARSLKVKQTRMLALVLPDITKPFFPEIIRGAEDTAFPFPSDYREAKSAFERAYLTQVLSRFEGKINLTAKRSGLSKVTLIDKIRRYEIDVPTIKFQAHQRSKEKYL